MTGKVRVVHVINSFEPGGAETMLCNLLLRTDRDRFEPSVVALIHDLTLAGPVFGAGIPIATMGMKAGIPDPRGLARLARHLWRVKPAIVQTWMDHSSLIGGIAARLASRARVVWGIHHSQHIPELTKRSTLMTVNACGILSGRVPAKIICCSEHSRRLYLGHGFADDKMVVIPNGFDTGRFKPDPEARISVRRELGLAPDTLLIGLVARYDPFKDHANFLQAAARLIKAHPEVRFLLCGRDVDSQNTALTSLVASLGLGGHCHLIGPRNDAARIHASLDIAASSSISEAFPLVIGEAMACGVPCVATDVGDSALIVGTTGRNVPPRDPEALAGAWEELIRAGPEYRARLGAAARDRVCRMFDLTAITRRYEQLYLQLARAGMRRAAMAPGPLVACPEPTN